MENFLLEKVQSAHWILQLLYTWREIIIGIGGPVLAAGIAVWQVRRVVNSTREQYFETVRQEQEGILRALAAELSAFLYFQLDALENLAEPDRPVSPFPTPTIFKANAGRVGAMTGRAFGMLTIYYDRLENLLHLLSRKELPADAASQRLMMSLGHGAMIRAGLLDMSEGRTRIQLSAIGAESFEKTLAGFTAKEKELITSAREVWMKNLTETDRS